MSLWRGTLCANCEKEHECSEAERMLKSGGIAYGCSACVPKPMTHADRIRSMTDKELAEFLCLPQKVCPIYNCEECLEDSCQKCVYEWLRKEAESEGAG